MLIFLSTSGTLHHSQTMGTVKFREKLRVILITCENGQTVTSAKWNGLSKSFSFPNMNPFNLMDDFVFGDGLKKPMANFLE